MNTIHTTPQRAGVRRRPLRAFGVVAVAASLAFSACGDDDDGADPGQPVASGGFQSGSLADVPVPDDATSTGAASTSGDSTTESFLVEGVTPEQLIGDYQTLAEGAGWAVQTAAAQSGTDWSLVLTKDSSTLQVTTAPANDDEQSDQTELALILTSS
jgi:hypothetical protein